MPTVLVLGATSDIAVAVAAKFASHKYNVQLAARNINQLTAVDDVVITVGGGTPTGSTGAAPIANAGKDETIPVGQATTIRGEGSTASAGIKSYSWSKFSGPASYEMLTPNASSTWIRNMTAGTYVYRLTVTDNNGVASTDDVVITVYAASSAGTSTKQLAVVNETTAIAAAQPTISFQNPVRNNLDLNWNANYKGNATIKILDLNGKLLKTVNVKKNQQQYRNSIDVNGLKQGVFVMQIQTEDGKTVTNKFVKK